MLSSTEVHWKHATSSDTLVMCISSRGLRNLEGERSPTMLADRARFRGFNLFESQLSLHSNTNLTDGKEPISKVLFALSRDVSSSRLFARRVEIA